MKTKGNEKADWEKIFDLVAHESDPQLLSKYLDRLIQALHARNEQLAGATNSGTITSQLTGLEPEFEQEEDEEENERNGETEKKKETESA